MLCLSATAQGVSAVRGLANVTFGNTWAFMFACLFLKTEFKGL